MAVTIAPSTEAMQAIVARINSATTYCLAVVAEYRETLVDPLEEITDLRCDVVSESEEQLVETLATEDRTSHVLRIWLRKKLDNLTPDEIDPLKLLFRQIFQRVNNYDTTDRRVTVWECDIEPKEVPLKDFLQQAGLFVASIVLRVEVEAS
jgi:hypothetical protein